MKGSIRRVLLVTPLAMATVIGAVVGIGRLGLDNAMATEAVTASSAEPGDIQARVIALGIPGAGAVAEVGHFLKGGPIHDRATTFALFTLPGRVLDPKRVLVATTSNFGAPLARANEPEGAILSIDPAASALDLGGVVQFAASGTQAAAFGGAVQLYTAQSPGFVNGVVNPNAVTASLPAVSLPLGISINNGNGRPWFANAPNGANGVGTVSVIDPQGHPLAGAPSAVAGGVFSGTETNRNSSSIGGLTSATLGTAILSKSPDLTGRAVFAAVGADGSVVQIHVQKGVDQLAPPGTVTPVAAVTRSSAESTVPSVVARVGMAFNWAPTRNLFLADPQANRVVVLDLGDDGTLFRATTHYLTAPQFNVPIDIAPTTREIAAGSFASNSTLGVGSDLYVLNRGNNTIVRLGVNGKVQAVRRIRAPLTGMRANGIAVSSDGQTIYVTATTPGGGALLALPAFGQSRAMTQLYAQAQSAGMAGNVRDFSAFMFSAAMTPAHGLGPLFNQPSCVACHDSPMPGGMGLVAGQDILTVGRIRPDGSFDPLTNRGGPVARARSVAELGVPCGLPTGPARSANVTSRRNAMTLRGNGLIDDIAPGDILANMATQPPAVRGRPNVLADGRLGKFGWKANVATLVEFMGDALRNEMGMTNPIQPQDEVNGCGANKNSPEVDALALQTTAMFLNSIDPPAPSAACTGSAGAALFATSGCAGCHTPSLPGPGVRAPVPLYSDLLLHDMGAALADQMQQGSAQGHEWRTMPLWKVSERGKFLHDGRAQTLADAISAHGGQGQAARDAFLGLSDADKQAVIDFLNCL
jgi:mono/diheme cytochrome c family protein